MGTVVEFSRRPKKPKTGKYQGLVRAVAYDEALRRQQHEQDQSQRRQRYLSEVYLAEQRTKALIDLYEKRQREFHLAWRRFKNRLVTLTWFLLLILILAR